MAILHPHHLVLLLWTVSAVLSQDFQTLDPDLQPSQIDYGILQGFCMSQPTTSDCPVDMQFCKSAADCPAQFACSCMKGCGNLSCLLPENVQVCGCHPPPRNGYTLNRIGSVEFGCDPGFQLVGVEKKTCREGVWRPAQDFPKCNVLMCEELASISNGNTYFNPANEPTMFNSTATHQCLSGYTLVGSAQQTCQTTGQWSGQLPSCQRDGRLSNWTDWSECDALCSRGLKRRSRVCIEPDDGGQSCPADDLSEVDVCDSGKQCERVTLPATVPSAPTPVPSTSAEASPTEGQTVAIAVLPRLPNPHLLLLPAEVDDTPLTGIEPGTDEAYSERSEPTPGHAPIISFENTATRVTTSNSQHSESTTSIVPATPGVIEMTATRAGRLAAEQTPTLPYPSTTPYPTSRRPGRGRQMKRKPPGRGRLTRPTKTPTKKVPKVRPTKMSSRRIPRVHPARQPSRRMPKVRPTKKPKKKKVPRGHRVRPARNHSARTPMTKKPLKGHLHHRQAPTPAPPRAIRLTPRSTVSPDDRPTPPSHRTTSSNQEGASTETGPSPTPSQSNLIPSGYLQQLYSMLFPWFDSASRRNHRGYQRHVLLKIRRTLAELQRKKLARARQAQQQARRIAELQRKKLARARQAQQQARRRTRAGP